MSWAVASLPQAAFAQAPAEQTAPIPEVVAQVSEWVAASRDNHDLPFAIVDKSTAEVFVYGADGELKGVAPALLGLARGDDSTPGIGERELSSITPEERTTPAGRFFAAYGPAKGGKNVLWVDYATAISIHPVVTSNPKERRLQRLNSPSADDNRITFGCINVSAGFYEKVVRPTFTGTDGVFYVLPEEKPLAEVLPAFRTPQTLASGTLDATPSDSAPGPILAAQQ